MTTIRDLSEEVLQMIFDLLSSDDGFECQYVFRHWYTSAHVKFLQRIELSTLEDVDSFIKSIDHNPKQIYLNAVKAVTIKRDMYDNQDFKAILEEEKLNKLFFRFPNLQEIGLIKIPAVISAFSDKLCILFLEKCPKLWDFKVKLPFDWTGGYKYSNLMYKVRPLASEIETSLLYDIESSGLVKYLSSFPRLQRIMSSYVNFDNFQDWLPVFQNSRKLKLINIYSTSSNDSIGFAEKYLVTMSNEEQHEFMKNVSNINELKWISNDELCLNGLNFVSKYMTGLNKICITANFAAEWTLMIQRLFLNGVLDLSRTVNESRLTFYTTSAVAKEYLPTIIMSALHRRAETRKNAPNRSLAFVMRKKFLDPGNNSVDIKVHSNRSKGLQCVKIIVEDKVAAATSFFNSEFTLDNVDELQITMKERSDEQISKIYAIVKVDNI